MPERQPTSLHYEARGRGPGSRARSWAVVVIVVVVGVTVIGAMGVLFRLLGAAALHSMVTDTETLTPAQIERIGQFKFPPGAANIQSRYVSWLDFTLQVKFTLPPEQVSELLDSTQIRRPMSTTQIPWSLPAPTDAKDWWTPGTPASFEAGASVSDQLPAYIVDEGPDTQPAPQTTQPALRQFILIDKSAPGQYTVWLYISGE